MSNWTLNEKDQGLIDQILVNIGAAPRHRMNLEMGLIACHNNGCPLDLESMAKAGKVSDVVHDVYGIDRHMCRTTLKLKDCFWPRYAKDK